MALTILHTTHATATGGRNGHTQSADGIVSVDLSVPNSMGGPGKPGTTTPEDLFAAGYAACFGSACDFVARQMKLAPSRITVDCGVSIGQDEQKNFGLAVTLTATLDGLTAADAERVVQQAHQVCPYSRATRGNVEVQLKTAVVG